MKSKENKTNQAAVLSRVFYIQTAKADALMEDIIDFILGEVPTETTQEIAVAFEEAFVNIATYAYESGEGPVSVTVKKTPSKIEVVLDDCGKPYDPTKAKASKITDDFQIGGQGILLMHTYAELSYRRVFGHNMLKLTKFLHKNK